MSATIVWFRNDLRLSDNPALHAAIARGVPVIPVYIWSPKEEGDWPPGAASRVWLHDSLTALSESLGEHSSRLILRTGGGLETLQSLIRETEASAVYWNRRYEPAIIARDTVVKDALREAGVDVESFNGTLLQEPWAIQTKQGGPYRVFTPYWKSCVQMPAPNAPLPGPNTIAAPAKWPASATVDALGLEPKIDWAGGIRAAWAPGEVGAHSRLNTFVEHEMQSYTRGRDFPAESFVSRMSPYLHVGEISPRQIWSAVHAHMAAAGDEDGGAAFLREIGWREFSYHLLYHFPTVPDKPLYEKFAAFPWRDDPEALDQWQRGMTGFPIVDAGMRELWTTGWMHNRVRMIVASFLTKDLLIPWQEGARWFWDTLVDADLANNTQGWQWTAGCGADAAPYFRVFNPTTQGAKFDPDGAYVKRWIPELSGVPKKWVHRPAEAPADVLADANVVLGETYPPPVVDHKMARERALAAYETIRG